MLNFREVDKDNWEQCCDLCLAEHQKRYVATNWYSILQAHFETDLYARCIYDAEEMVGFLMYGIDPDTKRIEMSRLMIDEKHQGKGYGKASIRKLMEIIREQYGAIKFYTSIEPENIMAGQLYESIGFMKTGEIMWDEVVMAIQL